jgi:hypothetical protein
MLVQRVLTPDLSLDSWTVLGEGGPVEPIERYLAYLSPDAGCVDGVVDRSHTPIRRSTPLLRAVPGDFRTRGTRATRGRCRVCRGQRQWRESSGRPPDIAGVDFAVPGRACPTGFSDTPRLPGP